MNTGGRVATEDEARAHLTAFVAAFVELPRRDRWKLLMLEQPAKAARELHKLALEEKRAKWLREGERTSEAFKVMAGDGPGIYFSFRSPPVWMSVAEGSDRAAMQEEDAILSVRPGKLAIYFHHDLAAAVLRGP